MKIIVISPSGDHENEQEIVLQLFAAGLETYHLRKPKYSTKRMKQYLEKIPKQFHNRIVIHSHHNLMKKFSLKGIHLTKSHRTQRIKTRFTLWMVKAKNLSATVSVSHRRLISLFEDEGKYSYVFLSPIFDSLSGKYQSGFTDHSLSSALKKTHHSVIARGGTDANIVQKANELGFAGIALYSSIWKKKNPVEAFNEVVEKCLELNIAIE